MPLLVLLIHLRKIYDEIDSLARVREMETLKSETKSDVLSFDKKPKGSTATVDVICRWYKSWVDIAIFPIIDPALVQA